jgi:hypothetical protein
VKNFAFFLENMISCDTTGNGIYNPRNGDENGIYNPRNSDENGIFNPENDHENGIYGPGENEIYVGTGTGGDLHSVF